MWKSYPQLLWITIYRHERLPFEIKRSSGGHQLFSRVMISLFTDYFATSGHVVPYQGLAKAGVHVHLYHRTLEDYLAASHSAGLQLQRLVDVTTPPGKMTRRNDLVIPEGYHFPFFMILSFVKGEIA